MLARLFGSLLPLLAIGALPAHASFTLDLVWSDTGTPTLTLTPGEKNVSSAGSPCANSTAGEGRCLLVQLRAEEAFNAAVTTIGWNSASSGLGVAHVPTRSFGPLANGVLAPIFPRLYDVAHLVNQCPAEPCDVLVGSFGGAAPSVFGTLLPGTYVIGSVHLDASDVRPGTHLVQHFVRTGVGGVLDRDLEFREFEIHGARIIQGVPEPAAALLYASGLLLCAAGVRHGRRG